ncbi:MAG: aminotransferase class I/II-fold pyridoxal phosphate-dependent enzyme [Gammaproteobacteria bacterium]|nr:aminotransferase class I/II-fold pyridoxal phosphate-dependent enzyme [Gammaproteobacteria bacterium]
MSKTEARLAELQIQYDQFVEAGLKLDLTRGKPSAEQLDLSNELDGILKGFYILQDGTDVRNYGGILGIPEARKLGADLLGVSTDSVMVGGNSSLTLMYHYVAHKVRQWRAAGASDFKFLCPVPGYDRHFTICEDFDIEMINVPLLADGPDMDMIEKLVSEDAAIKGIWCVPKYANPTGQTYSRGVVERIAALPLAAADGFQIMWDNAYSVHDLEGTTEDLPDLLALAAEKGTADQVAILASTSKITLAGAGISFLAATPAQLKAFEKYLSAQTIGFDKVNQLRHVHFLEDMDGIKAHMVKHRDIIKPKFDLVLKKLQDHLGGKDLATWTTPAGGYFISLDTKPGLASEVVAMAGAAGVKLTPAGATYPYGKDPDNTNIRIAPTYPSIEELDQAMDVFVTCVELATLGTV